MDTEMQNEKYTVISTRCGSCGCGCPTILQIDKSDELVVVGRLSAHILEDQAVIKHVGEGEAAVIIPRSLLLEAAKSLL